MFGINASREYKFRIFYVVKKSTGSIGRDKEKGILGKHEKGSENDA